MNNDHIGIGVDRWTPGVIPAGLFDKSFERRMNKRSVKCVNVAAYLPVGDRTSACARPFPVISREGGVPGIRRFSFLGERCPKRIRKAVVTGLP